MFLTALMPLADVSASFPGGKWGWSKWLGRYGPPPFRVDRVHDHERKHRPPLPPSAYGGMPGASALSMPAMLQLTPPPPVAPPPAAGTAPLDGVHLPPLGLHLALQPSNVLLALLEWISAAETAAPALAWRMP